MTQMLILLFGTCKVRLCEQEIFSACPRCLILICFEHLNEVITTCRVHGKTKEVLAPDTDEDEILPPLLPESYQSNKKDVLQLHKNLGENFNILLSTSIVIHSLFIVFHVSGQDHVSTSTLLPESFELDGADIEENAQKRGKTNKKKILKLQRNMGEKKFKLFFRII